MIGVVHAYSRANAGDGLLVDLTVSRLVRAGVDRGDLLTVALDPNSFDGPVLRTGTSSRALNAALLRAVGGGAALLLSAASQRPLGQAARRLADCSAFVAVGGGYLRTPTVQSSLGTLINHLPQLAFVARSGRPSLYLPQSIGPLRGPVGRIVRGRLEHIDSVWVRDDSTVMELAGAVRVHRSPDLAVLEVADRRSSQRRTVNGDIVFVGRDLDGQPHWAEQMAALSSRVEGGVVWAVQAEGDASKSDRVFYESLGIDAVGGLGDVLRQREVSAVVSVRLHGALMAILAGVPAVHIAYDRKGPGAFGDLGLGRYCLDARRTGPDDVARLVRDLRSDPEAFWRALDGVKPNLKADSSRLDSAVKDLVRRAADR